jgi:hypothetical protein
MTKHYPDLTREVSATLAKLRADIPDTTRGFSALAQAATRDAAHALDAFEQYGGGAAT